MRPPRGLHHLFHYWLKIFAIAFGMGVVSGIVMAYQFGTNWSAFADKTGPVIGPLMAYEVLTAFFLEAGFLGVMLFGLERGRPQPAFPRNPDGRDRHADLGDLDLLGQFLDADAGRLRRQCRRSVRRRRLAQGDLQSVLSLSPRPHGARGLSDDRARGRRGRRCHLLRDHRDGPRVMLSMAMWMATLVAPVQILAGDLHGLNTLEHQPVKIMAIEGHFESHPDGAPLTLFGLPDEAEPPGSTRPRTAAPRESDPDSLVGWADEGLDTVPREDWPPVPIIFWSFRIMVGIGFLCWRSACSACGSAGAARCTNRGHCSGSRC